ncbi:hypothetical protein [Thiomonas sp. X19]|uniref:hypothetical protein n=1 Tax=Thiomonas sp. X19 TaxID=1050370 RepID=UPI000DD6AEB6|nr:hypothetical protein [Thiomonas sp. X19]
MQQRPQDLRQRDWQVLAQVLDPALGLLEASPARILASVRRLQALGLLVAGTRAGWRLTWRLDPGLEVGLTVRRFRRHHIIFMRLWAQAVVEPPLRDPLTRDLLNGMNDIERALTGVLRKRLANPSFQ